MPKLFDLVKVNIATTGTGTITFGAAASNAFWTPSEAGALDGDTVRYVIVDGSDREEGIGTIASSAAQMARTTVTKSKIGGVAGTTKLNLSGTAVLAFTAGAADILNPVNNLSDLASVSTARTNLGLGDTAVKNLADVFTFANATEATGAGTTYGARFAGGVEFAKKVFVTGAVAFASTLAVAGAVTASLTSDATSTTAGGSFTAAGGGAFAKKLFVGDAVSVTSSNAAALAVGLNGATNPALQVDASTASSATGVKIKSAAAAAGVAISVVSSGSNENLTIDAKGSGSVTLGSVSTGVIVSAQKFSVSDLTDATSTSAASVTIAGGLGVAKKLYVGDAFSSTLTTDATSATSAAAIFAGGVGVAKKLFVGGAVTLGAAVASTLTTDATSTTAAAATFSGGVGIAKKLYVGDEIHGVGSLYLKNSSADILAVRGTSMGYSSSYGVALIGGGASSDAISLGANVNGNTGNNFLGNGSEIFFKNTVLFVQANAGNTDWMPPSMALYNGGPRVGIVNTIFTTEMMSILCRASTEGLSIKSVTNGYACLDLGSPGLIAYFRNTSGGGVGQISHDNVATTTYGTSSDKRRKEDWKPFDRAGEIIDQLEVWNYKWKDHDKRGYGVLAQDAYKVFPDAIIPPHSDDHDWSADYSKFVPAIIVALQEARAEIAALKKPRRT